VKRNEVKLSHVEGASMKKKPASDKPKAPALKPDVQKLVMDVNKQLKGEGRVYLGSEHKETRWMKSGVLALDVVLGGGLPCAQLVELFGTAGSGKTTLALLSVAEVQRQTGGVAAWVAGEGFDKKYAKLRGVDLDRLLLIEAATGDTSMEAAVSMLESGHLCMMVIDSIQSLGTTREMTSGVETEAYGASGAPQMWGRVMRRLYSVANKGKLDNTVMLSISQVRAKIGGYGKGLDMTEGVPSQVKAILHWKGASVRCRKGEVFWTEPNGKGKVYAREFKLKCEKNKTSGSEGTTTKYIMQTITRNGVPRGLDQAESLLTYGVQYGLIEKTGSWYSLGEDRLGQGREASIASLRKDPELMEMLYEDIIRAVKEE